MKATSSPRNPTWVEGFRAGSTIRISDYGRIEGVIETLGKGAVRKFDLAELPQDWPVVAAWLAAGARHYLVAPLIAEKSSWAP